MTERTCDMCGDQVDWLNELTSDYRQDQISEICGDCLHESNKLLGRCLKAQEVQRINLLRRFMKKSRELIQKGKE